MSAKTNPVEMFADEPVPFAVTEVGKAVLDAMPQQPSRPRSWTFINRCTGETMSYRCMQNCSIDHSRDVGREVFPEDLWCWTYPEALTLPVNTNGTPEEYRVLDTIIKVEPYSPLVAQRLPYAVVELVEDHFIEGLDPDGYETVINTLQERLDQMRAKHAQLVAIRAAYMGVQG